MRYFMILLLLIGTAAQAQELPEFNIRAICERALTTQSNIDPQLKPAAISLCVAGQRESKRWLADRWNAINQNWRAACAGFNDYRQIENCVAPQAYEFNYFAPGAEPKAVRDIFECNSLRNLHGGTCVNRY